MKFGARNIPVLVVGLLLGVSISIGHGVFAEKESVVSGPLPLDELRVFTEVFAKIKSDYVEPIDDKTLLENAVRGMLSGLDPHSAYLDADAYREVRVGTSGEFGGLGIEVGMENGFVKVIAPIDDTPAQRAGVKSGDLIVRLDETPVKGLSLNEAVKLMRGKPGSTIVLTVVREGEEKPLKINVVRDVIRVKSVKNRLMEKDVGYVRISQFQANTRDNLLDAMEAVAKENGRPLRGLILDLRNNPGGVLNAAVEVSDMFLTDGLIVYTEGRVGDSKLQFKATPNDVLKGVPLVVLVNGGSASASEIVAGALQDHKRALIIGSKTFGKGSVQTILPLTKETALKLTTARYFTPSGRSIQAEGIKPDIELDQVKLAANEEADATTNLKEADLSRHLSNGNSHSDATATTPSEEALKKEQAAARERLNLAQEDYQLYEAVNMLKGLMFLKR